MPANDWEWYILTQVDRRLDNLAHPLKNEKGTVWKGGFMTTPRCYTFRDGAVIISQHQKMGTLLDLVNLTKNADKNIIEPIAIYLTAELLGLMELLRHNLPEDNGYLRDPDVDLVSVGVAAASIVVSGVLAGVVPAWRAAAIPPVVALQDE